MPMRDVLGIRHLVEVRLLHRAGVEGRDLVVIQVGGDEGLGGVLRLDQLHVVGGNTRLASSSRRTGAKSRPTVAIG